MYNRNFIKDVYKSSFVSQSILEVRDHIVWLMLSLVWTAVGLYFASEEDFPYKGFGEIANSIIQKRT